MACAGACGPSVVELGLRGGDAGDAAVSSAGASGAVSRMTPARSAEPTVGSAVSSNAVGVAGSPLGAAGMSGKDAAGNASAGTAGTAPSGSSGCGLAPPSASGSLQVGGSTTSYIVDIATGYDASRPYPVVVAFRGADVTASAFRRYLDLPPVVGADGIVVNLECADNGSTWDLQRDLPFFDALLTRLQSQYCVDPDRIFVVGHATGAAFANALGCMRSDVLRGLGSLSGTAPNSCADEIPVWITQGNADSTVTLGRANRDFWIRHNGCDASVNHPVEPAPCIAYEGCDHGFPVQYCEYSGNLNLPSFAATGVWAFFQSL